MPAPRDRFFHVVLGGGIAASIVPMWVVRIPPLGDLPAHLEMMDIVARARDASTIYPDTYFLRLGFIPNSVSLHVARLFGHFLPAHTVAQLIHSLYAIALPLSVLALARVFGRTKWAAVIACPLVFNAMFAGGFINYVIALPALVGSVAAARWHSLRPSLGRGLTLGGTLCFLLLSHMIAFSFGFAIAAAILLLHADRWRSLPARIAPLFAPVLPAFGWLWTFVFSMTARTEANSFRSRESLGLSWLPRGELILQIPYWAMQFFRNASDEIAIVLLMVTFFGLVALTIRSRAHRTDVSVTTATSPLDDRTSKGLFARLREFDLEIVIGCCVVAYFALPSNMTALAVIAERVVSLVMILLCALPRARVDAVPMSRRWVLPAVFVALLYPFVVAGHFVWHERHVIGRLPAMMAALPPRARVAYAMVESSNPITWSDVLWHLPKALITESRGGLTDDSFARNGFAPVNYRPGRAPPRIGPAGLAAADQPGLAQFDALLVRSERRPMRILAARDRVTLRDHDGIWWLFTVRRSRSDSLASP